MKLARNILLGVALLAGYLIVHVNGLFKAEITIQTIRLINWHYDGGARLDARERADLARYLEPCDLVVPHEGTNVLLEHF